MSDRPKPKKPKQKAKKKRKWEQGFIEFYVVYCDYSTDAPTAYSTWLGIQLLGHALGWDTVHLIQPKAIHHNIYLCLVGESTLSRKTTSQDLAHVAYPASATIAAGATPQRLVSDMSKEPHRMLWYGEFSKLLKQVKKGFMDIMVETLNDLYDCPEEVNMRSLTEASGKQSDYVIKKSYLSVNATVTPEMLEKNMSTELMTGGFLPRWPLVFGVPRDRPRGPLPKEVSNYREDIERMLTTIMNWSFKESVSFVLDADNDGYGLYNRMQKKAFKLGPNVKAFVGRYMDVLIKVADIMMVSNAIGKFFEDYTPLASVDSLEEALSMRNVPEIDGSFVVDNKFLKKAWKLIKPCIVQAEHLYAYVNLEEPVARLRMTLVKKAPLRHSSAMNKTGITSPKMKVAVQTLLEQDWIVYFERNIKSKKIKRRYTRKYYCRRDLFKTEKCEKCKLKAICFAQNP